MPCCRTGKLKSYPMPLRMILTREVNGELNQLHHLSPRARQTLIDTNVMNGRLHWESWEGTITTGEIIQAHSGFVV